MRLLLLLPLLLLVGCAKEPIYLECYEEGDDKKDIYIVDFSNMLLIQTVEQMKSTFESIRRNKEVGHIDIYVDELVIWDDAYGEKGNESRNDSKVIYRNTLKTKLGRQCKVIDPVLSLRKKALEQNRNKI